MLLLCVVHQMALGLFRCIAAFGRDMVVANTGASGALMVLFLLGGFIVPLGRLYQELVDKRNTYILLLVIDYC